MADDLEVLNLGRVFNPDADAGTYKSTQKTMQEVLDISPTSVVDSVIGETIFGINHRDQPNAITMNKDSYGYVFFTRPRMNLTGENLRMNRLLAPLLTKESTSYHRAIRCYLDPMLNKGTLASNEQGADSFTRIVERSVTSPLVDPNNAFIPLLGNNLISMAGWPDVDVKVFNSHNGIMNEVYSFVDGGSRFYEAFEITCNFRKLPGDPISLMIASWYHYAASVYLGESMYPYPEQIMNHEMDYNTRIYRLVMDQDKKRVIKVASTIAIAPISLSIGSMFNFERDRPFNQSEEQVSVRFWCNGAEYNDPITLLEFNLTVEELHINMRDGRREQHMRLLKPEELFVFNHRGYPRINLETGVLEWWVSNQEYNERLPTLKHKNNPMTIFKE